MLCDSPSDFPRPDTVVRTRLGDWRFMVSPAFRYQVGRSEITRQMAEQFRRDYVTSLRAEAVRDLSQRLSLVFGADLQVDAFSAQTIVENSGVGEPPKTQDARGTETWVGAYTTARLRLGPLLLPPHSDSFVLGVGLVGLLFKPAGRRVNLLTSAMVKDARVHPAIQAHFADTYRTMARYMNGGWSGDMEGGSQPSIDMLARGEWVVMAGDAPPLH